jgi:hypothetical protein
MPGNSSFQKRIMCLLKNSLPLSGRIPRRMPLAGIPPLIGALEAEGSEHALAISCASPAIAEEYQPLTLRVTAS